MYKPKKKTIIIFVVIIALLAVFFLARGKKSNVAYTTVKAERMNLQQTVEATGQVESAEAIKLNFKSGGRLERVLVKEGDMVKKGDLLAQLESRAMASQVADARARLTQAQADYEKLLAGASEADLQISYNTVTQREQSLATAQNTLSYTLSKKQTDIDNLRDTALDNLRAEIATARGALEEVNNTLTDPNAEKTLAIKDRSLLKIAEDAYLTAKEEITKSENEVNGLSNSNQAVILALDNLKYALNYVASELANTLNVLEATLTSNELSETSLDTLKSNIKTQQTKINSSQTSLQTAKSNLTSKITYYDDQVTYYQNAVKDAESALSIAQAQLDLKKSPPRSFDIQSYRARVDQARASLDLALANLADTQILAPVNGTITKKNFEVGEQTSLSTPTLEMIGETNLQIKVNIPEADIAKIMVGQNVAMTLDAFGPEKKFTGEVVFIDPAETKIQDVIYYQVKVQFNSNAEEVKPGMTANLTINIANRDSVIVVPTRAIKSKDGQKYVQTLTANQQVIEKDVVVGLKGDEGTEIISGLDGGEEVITFVKQ